MIDFARLLDFSRSTYDDDTAPAPSGPIANERSRRPDSASACVPTL